MSLFLVPYRESLLRYGVLVWVAEIGYVTKGVAQAWENKEAQRSMNSTVASHTASRNDATDPVGVASTRVCSRLRLAG